MGLELLLNLRIVGAAPAPLPHALASKLASDVTRWRKFFLLSFPSSLLLRGSWEGRRELGGRELGGREGGKEWRGRERTGGQEGGGGGEEGTGG